MLSVFLIFKICISFAIWPLNAIQVFYLVLNGRHSNLFWHRRKNWLYWSNWKITCSSQTLYFPRIIIAVFHWCLLSQLYNSCPDTSMPYSKPGSFQGNLALNSGNRLHFSLYFPVYPSVLQQNAIQMRET